MHKISSLLVPLLVFLGCGSPTPPKGSSVVSEPQDEVVEIEVQPKPKRPAVPKEKWKIKDAEAAKSFLVDCSAVKEGQLQLTVEQEATPDEPIWLIGLQIPNGPMLDRCPVDAETGTFDCRGSTCP